MDSTEWDLYSVSLIVFKAIVAFAEMKDIKDCVFYLALGGLVQKRGRERVMTPKDFFDFFAKRMDITIDKKMERAVRLWQHFLCRYVTNNITETIPTHIEIINE